MTDPGRVALVIDGATEIGAATSVELARRKCRVVVCDADGARAAETVEGITGDGGLAVAAVARPDSVDEMTRAVASARDAFGAVDIVVHSSSGSGSSPAWGEFRELSVEQMMGCIDGMLLPVLLGTRLVINEMVERRYGKVVFTSTVAAHLGARRGAPYAMAKAALDGLTRSLAKEVGRFGVNVNAVMFGGLGGFSRDPAREAQIESWSHLGRLGRFEEAARAIAFLCSDDASYLSGSVMTCDGGVTVSSLV